MRAYAEAPTTFQSDIAQLDEAWLQDRVTYEEHPDNAISVPIITQKWDETIQQCRDDLEEAAKTLRVSKKAADRAEGPDSRKRAQVDEDKGWAWRFVKDRGQRLWDAHEPMCFRVSLL